jgi:hypothetical protein
VTIHERLYRRSRKKIDSRLLRDEDNRDDESTCMKLARDATWLFV